MGLIRDSARIAYPEVWKGKWVKGSQYVLYAITGVVRRPVELRASGRRSGVSRRRKNTRSVG